MSGKPITPSELVAAVRPCLPLGRYVECEKSVIGQHVVCMYTRDSTFPMREHETEAFITGLIWQDCERRGWSIATMHEGRRGVWITRPRHVNDSSVCVLGRASGTSVLSLCAAYADAKSASVKEKQ